MYELPYGNTQQLNLDWFIKRWQEFYAQWQETEAGIDHALDAEVQRVEDAMTNLYAARDAAAASATAAAASAASANNDATIAANAATAAAASATLANTKATAAGLSEAAAALSASQAANDATAAATSASQASASASSATDSAQAAATSEQNIESIIEDAIQDATDAAVAEATADAEAAATAAESSASDAADSATAAAASATAADSSADDAADSATAAAASATAAAGSASDAADSATAAAASAASIVVDSAMSDSSTNPVQNKVINGELTQLKTATTDNINLFTNTNVSENARLNATGGLITGETGYFTSDYFEVVQYTQYTRNIATENIYYRTAYYDENKTHIATYTTQVTTAPKNAKYARFCGQAAIQASYVFKAYQSAKDEIARNKIVTMGEDIDNLQITAFVYESPNKFDYTNSSLVMENKVINASGNIADSTTDNVLLIPVSGIDGNAYQLYAPNSDGTKLLAQSTRFSMLNSEKNRISMLVNNQTTPAVISSNDCVYLACYISKAKYGTGTNIMILANAYSTSLDISGYIPYGKKAYRKTNWFGKKWSAYGDSITGINNSYNGFAYAGWARYINELNGVTVFYGRGIGNQSFAWGTAGGSVCFIESGGELNSRDDNYNKDNYTGTVPTGCTATRGAFCSWDRITHMFPVSIKDTIDMVFIMGGTNDTYDDTALAWVAEDDTDTEWAASDAYETYGGDYNISTLRGGIASTIMKMQAWMPNAIIIIGTPYNGRTGTANAIAPDVIPAEYSKSIAIKETAEKFGCPVIDVFGDCGVNVLNSPTYITDGTHPYNAAGQKMLARAVNGGLARIMPHI